MDRAPCRCGCSGQAHRRDLASSLEEPAYRRCSDARGLGASLRLAQGPELAEEAQTRVFVIFWMLLDGASARESKGTALRVRRVLVYLSTLTTPHRAPDSTPFAWTPAQSSAERSKQKSQLVRPGQQAASLHKLGTHTSKSEQHLCPPCLQRGLSCLSLALNGAGAGERQWTTSAIRCHCG